MGIYKELLNELDMGRKVGLLTTLDDAAQIEKAYYTEAELANPRFAESTNPDTKQLIQQALTTGELQLITTPEQKVLVAEPFFPEPSLIIFGGGHVGKAVYEFGMRLGFLVTVVDDRIEFANRQRFPDAHQVICESFEKALDLLQLNPHTYIILVTRGHSHDLACLREVAKKTWAYAGMIGSRRRVRGIIEKLIDEGTPREILERINTPIGLEIGAITPEEIAISILGQVISYRRLQNPELGRESARIGWTEFDRDVMEELSRENNDNKAIATIISTQGSTPRSAGAKMLVWPTGRILGSVGGGIGEAAVIKTARDIIGQGGYLIQTVNLTGSVAEDEGMVCGGTMKILIEFTSNKLV